MIESIRTYKAAPMSTVCGEFDRNPAYGDDNPDAVLLLRCKAQATTRITLQDSVFREIKLCCGYHAAKLRHQERRGQIEILEDRPIGERYQNANH